MPMPLGFDRLPSYAEEQIKKPSTKTSTKQAQKQAQKTDEILECQYVSNPTYVYNRTDDYQNKITGKIQDILHGKKSISFENLLKRNSDIATIYNGLSSEGKKLVEFVISQDDKKGNVTERELRNLYRLMDMNGGHFNMSFYDGDITDGSGLAMIEYLTEDTTGKAKDNLRRAHLQTKTTKELAQQRSEKHLDIQG